MVAIEEEPCIEVILPGPPQPLIKPIELKNIGFLQKHPTYINCPACLAESMSVVRLEVVTCWQKFLKFTNMCKTSESRYDINHYCSICGCFIGRFVSIGCGERCISKRARKKAANDAMTLKTKPRDCAEHMQKARERVKENRAKEKAKKAEEKKETNEKN
ncbi:uncharacterized protein LOC119614386 [Lucilia sericata]|uniref:uncharacterized protein LOC119614386 n=1 Tax=Lucilia sericata TaxID=13632 RepID=UPI0018A7E8E5|nr:uncharacterized protein LOC119614386 [Lucilia sericata]